MKCWCGRKLTKEGYCIAHTMFKLKRKLDAMEKEK